jgi:alpha/beta superfamily hydrolase
VSTERPGGDGGPGGNGGGPLPRDPGEAGGPGDEGYELSIQNVRARPTDDPGEIAVLLETSRGPIEGLLRPCEGRDGCAIYVGGASGGVQGPAGGIYEQLSRELVAAGVTSLRLDYREPGELVECVLDALAGCSFLKGIGAARVVLVGSSFGGAVAIRAGGLAPLVSAVAALAPQRSGTEQVEALGKPLLLVHGDEDAVLDRAASDDIFARAREPKRLAILEGAGHALDERAGEVHELLTAFVTEHAGDTDAE